MTFVAEDFVLSYDDRYVISDIFFSRLSKQLQSCVRYDSIYITQDKNKDFKLELVHYMMYIVNSKHGVMKCKGHHFLAFFLSLVSSCLSFIFCGTVLGNVYPMWTPGLLAFSLTLIREITKDIADLEGDQIAKYNTYPIQHGIKGAIKLISLLSLVVCLVALVPYFNNTYNNWYLIILLIGVEIPLIIIVLLFIKNPTISSAIISSKILKLSTIMGLLAIYTGSL